MAYRNPKTIPDAYVTDDKRLLRALCETDQPGFWAFEDCATLEIVQISTTDLLKLTLVRRAPKIDEVAA